VIGCRRLADLTSSERGRRLTETSLVSMSLLELRPQANEGIGDEATVQHRFIRLTSLVLALLVPLAAGLGYLSVGPHLFTGATTTVVALYFVSLLLLHLLARRRRGRWLAYALVALINGLPLLLAALHHDPITRISLVVLMIPAVVIASPLLGPRHGVALALIDIACNFGLLLATRSQLSPALNAAAELWTLRVSVALLATAGVGWFFARGLHQLIDASQSAHSSLLARSAAWLAAGATNSTPPSSRIVHRSCARVRPPGGRIAGVFADNRRCSAIFARGKVHQIIALKKSCQQRARVSTSPCRAILAS
jgi:hypothetical protein